MSDIILTLAKTIKARRTATSESSYTKSLLEKGVSKCAEKFGEEAVEAIIAAVSQSDEALKAETADVLFHLLVMLESRNIDIQDVLETLKDRQGTSGHAEKAARPAQDEA